MEREYGLAWLIFYSVSQDWYQGYTLKLGGRVRLVFSSVFKLIQVLAAFSSLLL